MIIDRLSPAVISPQIKFINKVNTILAREAYAKGKF
jgi:hypothetical protein